MWDPQPLQITSPPVFDVHPEFASRIRLADISEGGICVVSRFPGVLSTVGKGVIDDAAKIYLPMQNPLTVGIEVRWTKRIKENIAMEHEGKFARQFRFGANFVSLTDEASLSIQQYIKQLALADAI
jgi:hypothetical protein